MPDAVVLGGPFLRDAGFDVEVVQALQHDHTEEVARVLSSRGPELSEVMCSLRIEGLYGGDELAVVVERLRCHQRGPPSPVRILAPAGREHVHPGSGRLIGRSATCLTFGQRARDLIRAGVARRAGGRRAEDGRCSRTTGAAAPRSASLL
jgi:hypothetical protein